MTNIYDNGEESPIKYTIEIDTISDMPGYVVEITDKINSEQYTLSGIYKESMKAIKAADTFVNNLVEKEISMFIN